MKMLVDISRTKFLILKTSWSHVETQIQNTADHHKTNCGCGSSAVTTVQGDIGHILGPVIPEGGITLPVTGWRDREPVCHRIPTCYDSADQPVTDEKWRRGRAGTSSPPILSMQSTVSNVIYNAKQEKATYLIWSKSKQTEIWFSLSRLC